MKSPISILAVFFSLVYFLSAQEVVEGQLRTLTNKSGRSIEAILLDKDATSVVVKLPNGQRAQFAIEELIEEHQKLVRDWDMEKDLFLRECRTLTVRELLELRGYESLKYQLEGNHIYLDGKLNDRKARFMIDTGAHGMVIHIDSAKEAECELGPFGGTPEKPVRVYGIGGSAPASETKLSSITLGETVISDIQCLSADLYKDQEKRARGYDAIFGADFLHQLDAVISYKEGRCFFRPDLADKEKAETGEKEDLRYRLFRLKDGKSAKANVKEKTATAVTLEFPDGKTRMIQIIQLIDEDADWVRQWTPARDLFIRKCGSLTVQDILELRNYQSFEYTRQVIGRMGDEVVHGNHIFVNGKLNEVEMPFLIDTGAGSSVIDVEASKKAECEVGPFNQKIYGVAGEAPAAVTKVNSIEMGKAKITNRKLLTADLFEEQAGERSFGAIFGADFMRELNGVINYREDRIFLRQD